MQALAWAIPSRMGEITTRPKLKSLVWTRRE